MSTDSRTGKEKRALGRTGKVVGWTALWAWSVAAGGGGFLLLLKNGPLPLTNGWFAMFSGIAACPLTAMLVKKLTGIAIPVWIWITAAALIFIAGRIALLIGI
jgi:hypothetical protein